MITILWINFHDFTDTPDEVIFPMGKVEACFHVNHIANLKWSILVEMVYRPNPVEFFVKEDLFSIPPVSG